MARRKKPRAVMFRIPLGLTDEQLKSVADQVGRLLRPPGCTCEGHKHQGGRGGCYFGGTLVPRCGCTWVDSD